MQSDDKFLSREQVLELTSLKTWQLRALIKEGKFPKPVPITLRTNVWPESSVREWMRRQLAEAESRRAQQAEGAMRAVAGRGGRS